MQIRDDLDTLPELAPKRRGETARTKRLLDRNQAQAEDETVRMPMSALASWHDPMNPDLETLQVRLDPPQNPDLVETVRLRLAENAEDEETLVGPWLRAKS